MGLRDKMTKFLQSEEGQQSIKEFTNKICVEDSTSNVEEFIPNWWNLRIKELEKIEQLIKERLVELENE